MAYILTKLTGLTYIQGGDSFGALGVLGLKDNFDLSFITNNAERLRIAANGYVGIGTTAPATDLVVSKPAAIVSIMAPSGVGPQVGVGIGPSFPVTPGIRLGTFGYALMNTDGSAIGYTASMSAWTEAGWTLSSRPTYIAFSTVASGTTALGEAMRITSTKNLLIGTTTDNTKKLQVNGAASFTNDILVNTATIGRGNISTNIIIGNSALTANTTGEYNIAIGDNALQFNTSGGTNIAVGGYALGSNTGGMFNNAYGNGTLYSNTTGVNNSAFGHGALSTSTTASNNTAFGYIALGNLELGSNNSVFGFQALGKIDGNYNIAFGRNAGYNSTSGDANIIIGNEMDLPSLTGSNQLNFANIIFGTGINTTTVGAGRIMIGTSTDDGVNKLQVTGTAAFTQDIRANGVRLGLGGGSVANNVAVGQQALAANTTGNLNTAVGSTAAAANTTGVYLNAFGHGALVNNTTGSYNIAIGNDAMFSNTTGSGNTVVGEFGFNFFVSGNNNIVFGTSAALNQTSGNNNVIIGSNMDLPSLTGSNQLNIGNTIFGTGVNTTTVGAGNIMIGTTTDNGFKLQVVTDMSVSGVRAGKGLNQANSSTAFGRNNLQSSASGADYNTAIGAACMTDLTTSTHNTSVGYVALQHVTTGARNTALGSGTYNGANGNDNVSVGTFAQLLANTNDSGNTAVGSQAMYGFIGSGNIAIGFMAAMAGTTFGSGNGNNNIIIGTQMELANKFASNQLNIGNIIFGNGINTSTQGAGRIMIGTITDDGTSKLQIAGRLAVTGANGYTQLVLKTAYTPTASSDANGVLGSVAWDDNYVYVKVSTGWKRSALTTF